MAFTARMSKGLSREAKEIFFEDSPMSFQNDARGRPLRGRIAILNDEMTTLLP